LRLILGQEFSAQHAMPVQYSRVLPIRPRDGLEAVLDAGAAQGELTGILVQVERAALSTHRSRCIPLEHPDHRAAHLQ
jgi:hypothetical protein